MANLATDAAIRLRLLTCCVLLAARYRHTAAHLLRATSSSLSVSRCSPSTAQYCPHVISCSLPPTGCAHIVGWLLPVVAYPLPAMSCPLLTACDWMLTVGCCIVRCSLLVRSFANVPSGWLFTRSWLHADTLCTSYLMFTLLSNQSNIRATDHRCNRCPLSTICAVVCWVDYWYPLCSLS